MKEPVRRFQTAFFAKGPMSLDLLPEFDVENPMQINPFQEFSFEDEEDLEALFGKSFRDDDSSRECTGTENQSIQHRDSSNDECLIDPSSIQSSFAALNRDSVECVSGDDDREPQLNLGNNKERLMVSLESFFDFSFWLAEDLENRLQVKLSLNPSQPQ